jgi:beta-N-acetylhexosaminidase
MDPKEGLLYIFLSNRTYPDAENWKLSTLDVRTNIQGYLYDALN